MQIVFLNRGNTKTDWERSAWDAIAAVPAERREVGSADDVASMSMWRVGCVVGFLDSEEPDRLAELIQVVRTCSGGPDVPIIVCGAMDPPDRGIQWAHAHGADDFLATTEPASRLLKRVETFAGVSGDPPPVDRAAVQRQVIQSLRTAAKRKRNIDAGELAAAPELVEAKPAAAVVTKNIIALPNTAFVSVRRPNGFGPAREGAPARTYAPAPEPASAPAAAPASAAAPAPASAPAPVFNPAAQADNTHVVWLRKRLVEIRESDYFAILRVPRDASDDDIRAAYEATTREFATAADALGDALAGPLAEVRAGLTEAFDVLADASLRANYRVGLES